MNESCPCCGENKAQRTIGDDDYRSMRCFACGFETWWMETPDKDPAEMAEAVQDYKKSKGAAEN